MTEHDETQTDEEQYRPTLGETSHTNPFTGEVFGSTQTYDRGKTVAADGGEADAVPEEPDSDDDDGEVLRDIDHTPPEGAESANAVHARGGEAGGVRDETEE
ncbi:hypothetical protein N0B31_08395 [Salinirubellus salinus]|uniref:Uncharacterized protein n=1 Tax=Salinirubellus salinus TaxID=1364945 RepID=A0A9E7R809_9EURY|nr:hypothetical protein [Salinirubellus salinus]UWM56303.1 hypothetical protein N0B31_08395 [Salinirubellus salinus]